VKLIQWGIILYGILITLVGACMFFSAFFTAYFNPSKTTMISINSFGEANWEFILFSCSIPAIIYAFSYLIKRGWQLETQ
jgi:hypothetical protein